MATTTRITSRNNTTRQKGKLLSLPCITICTIFICIGILSYSMISYRLHPDFATGSQGYKKNGLVGIELPDRTKEQHEACLRMKSVKDIQTCYPPQLVRRLDKKSCGSIETWSDVQRCLSGSFYPEDHPPDADPFTIHVVGERHSGTKFLQQELQSCFLQAPSAQKYIGKVHRDFVRVKHFFQPIRGGNHRRSITVVIVRDPVEWVAAMQQMPYHSPNHIKALYNNSDDEDPVSPLTWKEFVSRPWGMNRTMRDAQVLQDLRSNSGEKYPCQDSFKYEEVVPCQPDEPLQYYNGLTHKMENIPEDRKRGFRPLYELRRDGSGKPYDHILQLRSDKIVNMVLQVPMLTALGGYMVVRYEDMLRRGSSFVLEQVAEIVGMDKSLIAKECPTAAKPQPERLGKRFVQKGFQAWIEENLDLDRERLLGYR